MTEPGLQIDRFARPASVLVVDDDPLIRKAMRREFAHRDWTVRVAANQAEAEDTVRKHPLDLILVDLMLANGESGLDVIESLKAINPGITIVLLTGYPSMPAGVDAIHLGATTCLAKPARFDEIIDAIRKANKTRRTRTPATKDSTLARTEREHIERTLAECNNNKSEAARRLGIAPRSIRRKLQKKDKTAQ